MFCPKCGKEVKEDSYFCMYCGFKLVPEDKVSPEDAIRNILTQRIEAIKNRDAKTIESLVDPEKYTKFDDWPPFELQGSEALKSEAQALKVLKEYDYEIHDWKIDTFENVALSSFIIHYHGTIRNRSFNIRSRVTALLVKKEEGWKLVHEHWSRFPERFSEERMQRRRRFPW